MPVMVDSCVLLDILNSDPRWYDWSASTVSDIADSDTIVVNPVIYSEVSVGFTRIEQLEYFLAPEIVGYLSIPRTAAFLAGKCFLRYRRRGGSKVNPLPDFFIGAHASVAGIPLMTRDTKRFRDYFPSLELISPH